MFIFQAWLSDLSEDRSNGPKLNLNWSSSIHTILMIKSSRLTAASRGRGGPSLFSLWWIHFQPCPSDLSEGSSTGQTKLQLWSLLLSWRRGGRRCPFGIQSGGAATDGRVEGGGGSVASLQYIRQHGWIGNIHYSGVGRPLWIESWMLWRVLWQPGPSSHEGTEGPLW